MNLRIAVLGLLVGAWDTRSTRHPMHPSVTIDVAPGSSANNAAQRA